jgi:hypothetical protein
MFRGGGRPDMGMPDPNEAARVAGEQAEMERLAWLEMYGRTCGAVNERIQRLIDRRSDRRTIDIHPPANRRGEARMGWDTKVARNDGHAWVRTTDGMLATRLFEAYGQQYGVTCNPEARSRRSYERHQGPDAWSLTIDISAPPGTHCNPVWIRS